MTQSKHRLVKGVGIKFRFKHTDVRALLHLRLIPLSHSPLLHLPSIPLYISLVAFPFVTSELDPSKHISLVTIPPGYISLVFSYMFP